MRGFGSAFRVWRYFTGCVLFDRVRAPALEEHEVFCKRFQGLGSEYRAWRFIVRAVVQRAWLLVVEDGKKEAVAIGE